MIRKNNNKLVKIILSVIIFVILITILKSVYDLNIIKKERGFIYGNNDAPIVIEEYSSFECGSCRDFHLENGEVLNQYIKDGKVKYILRPVDIERFEYDDYIYKHLSKEKIKDLSYINRIFETQDEWINFENKEKLNDFLMLKSIKSIYYNDNFIWKKDELAEKKIQVVPYIKVNNEVLNYKITQKELIEKIESLKK